MTLLAVRAAPGPPWAPADAGDAARFADKRRGGGVARRQISELLSAASRIARGSSMTIGVTKESIAPARRCSRHDAGVRVAREL